MAGIFDLISFSEHSEQDLPFIYTAWIQCHWSEHRGQMQRGDYRRYQRHIIDGILGRSSSIVAHNIDDPDQIFAFIIFESDCLHYIYVKSPFRRAGLGNDLLCRAFAGGMHPEFEYSHSSEMLHYLIGLKEHNFNIFRAFYDREICGI